MTQAEVKCLVARTGFGVVADGVGSKVFIAGACPCGINVGAFGYRVGVAQTKLIRIIVGCVAIIFAYVGSQESMIFKWYGYADHQVIAFG